MDTGSKKTEALALLKENRLEEARDIYAGICEVEPTDAESWFRLGTTNLELNAMPQAEACFRRVIELRPNLDRAYYNLGRSLEIQGKDDEAITVYRRLLQIKPDIEAYNNIGIIYEQQGKFAEAQEVYRQGQQLDPTSLKLIVAEAMIYERQGDYHSAYALIQPFLEAGRESPEIAMLLASLSRHLNRHEQAIDLLERLLARGDWSGNKRIITPMHFALGDLLDATGNYDRAFDHFRQGNKLCYQPFDSAAYAERIDAIMRIFNADFVRQAPRAALRGDHLIFIVGMPRSGTTLVEQILSSHSQVYGCGELKDVGALASSLPDAQGANHVFPEGVVFLSEEACTQLARRYVQRVGELSGGADFVTDKMPQNFQFLGLIAMLFPGAKVIHCVRDPLDTCLSCYFKFFRYLHNSPLAFTTDLTNLGAYYRQYQRLMQHWKAVLDIPMLDISYEMMVENQEDATRELLSFCGLPWDERCLKFYDSRRDVATASYNQVRQPIYRKSVQRWKHYEQYLEPLKKALSD